MENKISGLNIIDLIEITTKIPDGLLNGKAAELYYLGGFQEPLSEELYTTEVSDKDLIMHFPADRITELSHIAPIKNGRIIIELDHGTKTAEINIIPTESQELLRPMVNQGFVVPRAIIDPSTEMTAFCKRFTKLTIFLTPTETFEVKLYSLLTFIDEGSSEFLESSEFIFPHISKFMAYLWGMGVISGDQLNQYKREKNCNILTLTDIGFQNAYSLFPEGDCTGIEMKKLITLIIPFYRGDKELRRRLVLGVLFHCSEAEIELFFQIYKANKEAIEAEYQRICKTTIESLNKDIAAKLQNEE